jgi:hypothetical protein
VGGEASVSNIGPFIFRKNARGCLTLKFHAVVWMRALQSVEGRDNRKVSGLSRQRELLAGKLGFVHLGTFRGPLFYPHVHICHPRRSPVVPQRGVACGCPGRWGHALTNVLTIASHWLPTKRGFAPFTPSITISLRTSKRPSAPLSYDDSDENREAAEFWGATPQPRELAVDSFVVGLSLLDFECDVAIAAPRYPRNN